MWRVNWQILTIVNEYITICPETLNKQLTKQLRVNTLMPRHEAKYRTVLERHLLNLQAETSVEVWGSVCHVGAQSINILGLTGIVGLGDLIRVKIMDERYITGEIISLEDEHCVAMLYERGTGLKVGQKAFVYEDAPPAPSDDWIGRVLGFDGQTVDGYKPIPGDTPMALLNKAPGAILRKALGPRIQTGVAAIDTFLPLCQGQRVGLFAGSGVGKSTLLGAMANDNDADINVIALVGERGREVRAFVEHTLGDAGMKKSIIFVSTSDQASAVRLRTAHLAMTTAEYFRDKGKQVVFMCDSLTRYADAHRDVALTAGEVPSLRAYPPSTFGALSAFCERAGPGIEGQGDITGIFSVLVAGSNMEEPVADMVRGILDGHIILDRDIAERGRYPAINISRSISRSLPEAATVEENKLLADGRRNIRVYEESRTLIQAGLYVAGSDPALDRAIQVYPNIDKFAERVNNATIEDNFKELERILTHDESQPTQT